LSNKKNKVTQLRTDITDAEIVEKTEVAAPVADETPQQDAETAAADRMAKRQLLDTTTAQLLKTHTEKNGIAFEFLKSALTQKSGELAQGGNFDVLVANSFKLADKFKDMVDQRWQADVDTVNTSIYGTPKLDG